MRYQNVEQERSWFSVLHRWLSTTSFVGIIIAVMDKGPELMFSYGPHIMFSFQMYRHANCTFPPRLSEKTAVQRSTISISQPTNRWITSALGTADRGVWLSFNIIGLMDKQDSYFSVGGLPPACMTKFISK